MSSDPAVTRAARPHEVRLCLSLAAIAAWTVVVPYLGMALGLTVDVPAIVEVVDHVIPGAVTFGAALYLASLARRHALRETGAALLAAGVCLLAGFWVLATHVPLIGDAARADQAWDAAIWHSITALPIVVLAVACVRRAIPEP